MGGGAMTNHTFAEQAGTHAADLWLMAAPASMAEWRDKRFKAFASGLNFPGYHDRQQAFNSAYARRIAQAIAQGNRHDD